MTDQEQSNQGRFASDVIDNPSFKAAIQSMREEVIRQWKACPIRDSEGQLLLLQLAKLTDKFEGTLLGFIQGGKLAQEKINLDALRNESAGRKLMRRVL